VNIPATAQPTSTQATSAPSPTANTAYADLTIDYLPCPLVRMSRELGDSKIECVGTGTSSSSQQYVKFIIRKEGHPAGPEAVLKFPGIQQRYEGDGFYAYRLYTPPCPNCFFPLLANHGLVPLKSVATKGELHLATLVEDLFAFKELIADFRSRDTHPKVNLLTHEMNAHTETHRGHPSLDELTPRQREVLENAYHAGYFHGKNLDVEKQAKDLGMSISTYYSHLRLASHKVLQHVLSRTEP